MCSPRLRQTYTRTDQLELHVSFHESPEPCLLTQQRWFCVSARCLGQDGGGGVEYYYSSDIGDAVVPGKKFDTVVVVSTILPDSTYHTSPRRGPIVSYTSEPASLNRSSMRPKLQGSNTLGPSLMMRSRTPSKGFNDPPPVVARAGGGWEGGTGGDRVEHAHGLYEVVCKHVNKGLFWAQNGEYIVSFSRYDMARLLL